MEITLDMKISKLSAILLLAAAMALTACKGKNSSKSDTAGKNVNLDTNRVGVLSDSTMGKVPKSGKDSTKNAAPGTTGAKAQVDSVKK